MQQFALLVVFLALMASISAAASVTVLPGDVILTDSTARTLQVITHY